MRSIASQPVNRRDLHLLHASEEEENAPREDDFAWEHQQCYSLEPKPNETVSSNTGKKYFVNLPINMSDTGSYFTSIRFQIDTAATCKTISNKTLSELLPNTKVTHSPYLLFPYGNARPIKPLGQVELLCDRHDKYNLLVFQVLPASQLKDKPALL